MFTDTPGLHKARNRLGEYMDGVVRASVTDVDAAVLVVEPIPKPGAPELQLMERMKALNVPGVLVINKIDTLEQKDKLLEVIDAYQQEFDFDAILPISAQKGDGVPELMDTLTGYLTEGPQLFPEDMTTDQPERQVMAEILREKMLRLLQTGRSPTARRWRSPDSPSGIMRSWTWRLPSTAKRPATRASSSESRALC